MICFNCLLTPLMWLCRSGIKTKSSNCTRSYRGRTSFESGWTKTHAASSRKSMSIATSCKVSVLLPVCCVLCVKYWKWRSFSFVLVKLWCLKDALETNQQSKFSDSGFPRWHERIHDWIAGAEMELERILRTVQEVRERLQAWSVGERKFMQHPLGNLRASSPVVGCLYWYQCPAC